jgi:two-component system sensor histidine kinase PilS (NtrC family)
MGDESWFGAFGPTTDGSAMADESQFTTSWHSAPPNAARAVRTRRGGTSTTFERIYRAFIAARAALGVALVVTLALASVFGLRPTPTIVALSLAFATLAISMWMLPRFRRGAAPHTMARLGSPQWIATIGVDLVFFTGLHLASPGSSFNYVALLVLPVLMAGVLTPRVLALATAALATLALLGTAWLGLLSGGDGTQLMTQAGLAGSGFFVITVLAGELAGRLAREELSARGSLEMARQQAALNRLVIEEMRRTASRWSTAAARSAPPTRRAPPMLAPAARRAPHRRRPLRTGRGLRSDPVERRRGSNGALPGRCFRARVLGLPGQIWPLGHGPQGGVDADSSRRRGLEDVRNVQARSRQEKLAAMGRVSAGIAHEIRNPLAAIAQANALLAEDATDPAQRQLTKMVTENVERLKRIVDDVMEVAPGRVQEVGAIDATALLAEVCGEWARAAGVQLGEQSILRVELPGEPPARCSIPSICGACSSTCSTTPAATPAIGPGRSCWRCAPKARRAPSSASPPTARRSRPRSKPICSTPFSRPAAAAPAWAFTFAGSSARDTGRASTTA